MVHAGITYIILSLQVFFIFLYNVKFSLAGYYD